MSDELHDLIRLNLIPGIGPRLQHLLLSRFGSAAAVFQASGPELLQVPGVGVKLSVAVTRMRNDDTAEQEVRRCREQGISLILRDAPDYPAALAETHTAPMVLYCRGKLEQKDALAVAIVGSRRCTLYGRQQAQRLAGALARSGLTIVSGLARGIDAAAHWGALDAGGRTIGVCATGLNKLYPPEHADLADEIAVSGAVLSESPLDRPASRGIFPQRNRIISGLSLGVVIVEANRKSGALHTARHAMEQGREVFAVPGRIDSLESQGCLDLIRDGATLVRNADDVLDALGPLTEPVATSPTETVHTPRELSLSDQERAVLNLVAADPQPIDALLHSSELETSRVLATLTILEMKRLVRRLPGSFVMRST